MPDYACHICGSTKIANSEATDMNDYWTLCADCGEWTAHPLAVLDAKAEGQ